LSIKDLRIFDGLPGKLRECVSFDESSVHLLSESILLTICSVPDIIRGEEENIDGDIVVDWPLIVGWGMICEVQC